MASSMLLLAGCDIKAKPSYDNDWLVSGDTINGKNATNLTNNLHHCKTKNWRLRHFTKIN